MGYWEDRLAKSQNKLTSRNIKTTEEQLKKYYKKSMEDVVGQFEKTYQHLLSSIEEGREPTPADLYKLDKYWQMQAQLKSELQKLGDKSYEIMSQDFENQYRTIYDSLSLPSGQAFNSLSNDTVSQMINQIWCADGKSWSQRIWSNTDKLQQALNDNLINCVLTGKKPTELKQMLMKDFNVSFNNADTIVRTEMAHIQTQAAMQRYKDYGITEVEILADEDERRCSICGKLHKKRYPAGASVPIPAHPRCRCTVIPVVDDVKTPQKIDSKHFAENSEKHEKSSPVLTKKKETTIIKLNDNQQQAQKKVLELQEQGNLQFYRLDTINHKRHCRELIGKDDEEALLQYQKMASDFLKKDIDGEDMDGFVSEANWLFKFEHSTGKFAIYNEFGKISTFFVPDNPEEYWQKQMKQWRGSNGQD